MKNAKNNKNIENTSFVQNTGEQYYYFFKDTNMIFEEAFYSTEQMPPTPEYNFFPMRSDYKIADGCAWIIDQELLDIAIFENRKKWKYLMLSKNLQDYYKSHFVFNGIIFNKDKDSINRLCNLCYAKQLSNTADSVNIELRSNDINSIITFVQLKQLIIDLNNEINNKETSYVQKKALIDIATTNQELDLIIIE